MAFFSALLAGLALAAPPQAATVRLAAQPSIVRADGRTVAAVVPGNGRTRCAQIVIWRLGGLPHTIRTHVQCGQGGAIPDRITEPAISARDVAWQEVAGGNNLDSTIFRARLERRI